MRHHWFRAIGLVFLTSACAINPATRRPEPIILSTSMEVRLGAQMHEMIQEEMGLEEDPALNAYVKAIGAKLAPHSPRRDFPYQFFIVDMAQPNAFAAPGGYLYVSRGLLAFSNSEDELANVLGHEIAHVASRHANQRAVRALPFAIVVGIPAAITGLVIRPLGNAMGAVGQFTGDMFLSPYSRAQEAGADRLGQRIAAAAGYDPIGMTRFMETFYGLVKLEGGDPYRTGWLMTHPAPASRVQRTQRKAERLERADHDPIAADHAAFLGKLDGLLVGLSGAEGSFTDNRFMHAYLDFSLSFPEEWLSNNSPTVVAAVTDDDKALLALSIVDRGSDPIGAGLRSARAGGVRLNADPKPLEINGLRAAHARGEAGRRSNQVSLDLTWIAHDDHIFQITGAAKPADFAAFEAAFKSTARSFRKLGAERDQITESRLRIARGRKGEELSTLVERTGGTWSVGETGVANAVAEDEPLKGNAPIKVPLVEPYRSKSAKPSK